MIFPERMRKVTLLVKNKERHDTIQVLARLKAVHIEDFAADEKIGIGEPEMSASELSSALTKAQFLLRNITEVEEAIDTPYIEGISHQLEYVELLTLQYEIHEERLKQLNDELSEIEEQQQLLLLLSEFEGPVEALFRSKRVKPILFRSKNTVFLKDLDPLVLFSNETILIAVANKDHGKAQELIKSNEGEIISMETMLELKGTPKVLQHELSTSKHIVEVSIAAEEKALADFSRHGRALQKAVDDLSLELAKAQAPLRFGSTRNISIVRGYVPKKRVPELQTELSKLKTVVDIDETEEGPTLLKNPPGANDFEMLMNLYTLPKYNEIDPTTSMAVTFPIFFGFMLGDIGYGLCVTALFTGMYFFIPKWRNFAKILILSGLSSIAFGIAFGEIFGLEQIGSYHLPYVIHRANDLNTMFMAALALGVFHINLGFLFGFINELQDGIVAALTRKGSWVLLEVALVFLAGAHGWLAGVPVVENLVVSKVVAYTTLALAIAGIAYGEGLKGIFEMPMIVSHTLSYLRLVAIGLASISLAMVINDMGASLIARGGLVAASAVFVIIIGHAINLALGMLGPFLHSLRLHYAEFFMKFYHGGGIRYRPFGAE